VCRKFTIPLLVHQEDVQTLQALTLVANMYGIPNVIESPQPSGFIKEGEPLKFGNSELEVRFVPGHAPGHVVFVAHMKRSSSLMAIVCLPAPLVVQIYPEAIINYCSIVYRNNCLPYPMIM
jgi:glyoxylase-like metal-dependent hydrolase (beta-lactamase superfamily II)